MSDQRLAFTLHHLVAELDGLADSILRSEFGITHSQFEFLLAVADTQPVDVTTLAARLAVSKAAVSKRVTWFVHRHYVSVSHENERGRRVVLSLTSSGAALARRAAALLDERFVELTSTVDGIDLPRLHHDLSGLLAHVRAAGGRRSRSKPADEGTANARLLSGSALVLGVVVGTAHVVAAIVAGMAARQWVSGAAIGAALVAVALAHLLIPGHAAGARLGIDARALGLLGLAAGAGVLAGLVLGVVFPWVRWGIVPVMALVAVVVVGRVAGGPLAKALRLAVFGTAAGAAFPGTDHGRATLAGAGTADRAEFAISFGVFAVLAGLLAHALMNRRIHAAPAQT